MIVNRRTFNVRAGHMEEAVALMLEEIAAEWERSGHSRPVRLYTSRMGTFDQMAVEFEYENLAEYEQFWTQWGARPTTGPFMQKWLELSNGGGSNEIWALEGQ
jgi:hypothetical protein